MYSPKSEQFFTYEETSSGMFGLFDEPGQIIEAAEKTREKKYAGFDCLTPFPVHGLEAAMGLPRSGIPWFTFFFGLAGASVGFLYQFLTHSYDWQLNIAGKAWNAWPAFVPVTFEMTIFWASFSTAIAMFILARMLSPFRKSLHPDITSHRFALWIPSSAPGYNEAETRKFLESLGAKDITIVKDI